MRSNLSLKPRLIRNLTFGIVLAIVVACVVGYIALRSLEPRLREGMLQFIEYRFRAKAEIEDLKITFFPKPRIVGHKLTLRFHGLQNLPPMISIDEFSASASLRNLLRRPVGISDVKLVGLQINVPPDRKMLNTKNAINKDADQKEITHKPEVWGMKFIVQRIIADGATLRILPKNPEKEPMVFDLYQLTIFSAADDHPLKFVAKMKNATPPGIIDSQGEIGPWNSDVPARTPVTGTYTFRDADLSVFKGISGKLSSIGKYRGVLNRIEVDGSTDTPDFSVRTGKHPMNLKTEFYAIVDGTNGDTLLQSVKANLGRSTFVCKGGIYGRKGEKGKAIELDVTMDQGRIQDLLQLVVPGKPDLVGFMQFSSSFELPPGNADVLQKLRLKGNFHVKKAEFTSATVQEKIEELSEKARGKVEDEINERIVSDLNGSFALRNGVVYISGLMFSVPGAKITLSGPYTLNQETLDFHGTLRMDAKLSETQKGIKSILLKVVDPFFRKKGKTVVPIKVTGTAKNVKFGLDLSSDDEEDDDADKD